MSKQHKAIDKFDLVTEQLIQLLEQGVKPWEKGWNVAGITFQNLITKHQYSGVNPILCQISTMSLGYFSPYFNSGID